MTASLWWDLDTCNVDSNQYRFVFNRVRKALIDMGVNEEIEFSAYYTETTLTPHEIDSLNQIDNLELNPVPSDEVDELFLRMMTSMGLWSRINPDPLSPYFLISGNGEFEYILRSLRDLEYPIFIAHPIPPPSDELAAVATRRWSWPDLSPIV